MDKKIFLLAGLPRSGNTLLSAILNQNPDIYSSPLSSAPGLLAIVDEVSQVSEHALRSKENVERLENIKTSFMDTFYKDVDKKIICDREKNWALPNYFELAKKYIGQDVKVIFTVRDILEIITSLIAVNGPKYLSEAVHPNNARNFYLANYFNENDIICEYLMTPINFIHRYMFAAYNGMLPENKNNFLFVEYNDLVDNSQETMNKIYDFIGEPRFNHDFNNIKKVEFDNDVATGDSVRMHDVKPTIQRSGLDPKNTLSEYMINKYSGMEFWKENSLLKVSDTKNF